MDGASKVIMRIHQRMHDPFPPSSTASTAQPPPVIHPRAETIAEKDKTPPHGLAGARDDV